LYSQKFFLRCKTVPLSTEVLGFTGGDKPYFFEQTLDAKVPDIIRKHSGENKQVLIFCPTKKSTETLCQTLATTMGRVGNATSVLGLASVYDEKLRNLIGKGYGNPIVNSNYFKSTLFFFVFAQTTIILAYHHAGIPADDRAFIESSFLSGGIHVLCATSTLAHGVNLPAHLVIIRGTNCWRGASKGYEKMPRSMITQMCGRAGRPGTV
jgi:ATP-dependent DNA helicase HFM1/MER3